MALASELQRGNCFLYKEQVVRVNKKELVTYGTHSHTKLKMFVENLFSGKQDVVTLAHRDSVEMVDVMKKKATIISKEPLQIMDLVSYETKDAEADENIKKELNEGDTVIFVDYKGEVKVLEKSR